MRHVLGAAASIAAMQAAMAGGAVLLPSTGYRYGGDYGSASGPRALRMSESSKPAGDKRAKVKAARRQNRKRRQRGK